MDAILALLNNPLVLLAFGGIVKYVPGVRAVISNQLIPYINTLLAFLAGVVAPQAAHAAGGPLALDTQHVALAGFGLGFLPSLGAALWQSAQAWILNEMLLRDRLPSKPKDSK